MTCLGVLDRGERGDGNGTSLKEGGLVEMSTTVLPFAMLAPSLKILTVVNLVENMIDEFFSSHHLSICDLANQFCNSFKFGRGAFVFGEVFLPLSNQC